MGREFRKSFELMIHVWSSETPIFSDGRGRADILTVPPVGDNRTHPAEKPVDLLVKLLEVCSGTVLDPFTGSGTTLLAARKSECKAIGIETSERYCEIAAKRLEAACKGISVKDLVGGQMALFEKNT